jgi:hypothetical protein
VHDRHLHTVLRLSAYFTVIQRTRRSHVDDTLKIVYYSALHLFRQSSTGEGVRKTNRLHRWCASWYFANVGAIVVDENSALYDVSIQVKCTPTCWLAR